MSQVPPKQPHISAVRQLAGDAIDKAGGDLLKARDLIISKAKKSKNARTALVGWAAYEVVRQYRKYCRMDKKTGVVHLPKENVDDASGLVHLAHSNLESIFETYKLPGSGKGLGDATPADLKDAIDIHHINATSNQVKARWFELIIKKMGKSKGSVRDSLTEETVMQLRNKARSEWRAK